MTKFTGKSQQLEFNSYVSGVDFCLTSVEYSDDIDDYVAECAEATVKEHVTGLRNITATVQGYLNQTDDDILDAFLPGSTNTDWVHRPAGNTATYIEITSTKATVTSLPQTYPVSGLAMFTFTVQLDNMTIDAV